MGLERLGHMHTSAVLNNCSLLRYEMIKLLASLAPSGK
jgi:hypothetical protein